MLHQYFDKTFLINLDRRPDRLFSVTKKCEAIGLQFERFSACDGVKEKLQIPTAQEVGQPECYWNLGSAGLSVTLRRIFERAKEENYQSVLILEDDVEFHPQINEFIEKVFKDIPSDWETIYFGANHARPYVHLTPHVVRLGGAYTTHCHAVHSSIFDLMIEQLSLLNNPVDVLYANLIHPRGKSYGIRPHVAYQAQGYSDIVNGVVNYGFLKS